MKTIYLGTLAAALISLGGNAVGKPLTTIKYEAVIDAGSSGTRLYFYKISPPVAPQTLPVIEPILTNYERDKEEDGIDDFVCRDPKTKPQSAVNPQVITPLLSYLKTNAGAVKPQQITVTLLATAGMRVAEKNCGKAAVDKLYKLIGNEITHEKFIKGVVKTTDGNTEEGIWTWLNLNYVQGTFQNGLTPLGDLELGGSSAQVVFPTDLPADPVKNIYPVAFNGKTYTVFSRSYLNVGQDDARKWIRQQPNAEVCWATGFLKANDHGDKGGYPNLARDGAFDFNACTQLYQSYLDLKIKENGGLPPTANSQSDFVGLDGVYYAAAAFIKAPDTLTQLGTSVANLCLDAKNFQGINDPTDPFRTQASCPNGTYVNTLLYDPAGLFAGGTRKVTETRSNDIKTTPGNRVRVLTWTRGYLLQKYGQ